VKWTKFLLDHVGPIPNTHLNIFKPQTNVHEYIAQVPRILYMPTFPGSRAGNTPLKWKGVASNHTSTLNSKMRPTQGLWGGPGGKWQTSINGINVCRRRVQKHASENPWKPSGDANSLDGTGKIFLGTWDRNTHCKSPQLVVTSVDRQ
jgi:hypothetical protein